MKVKAVYPGTFDPITNGHTDLVERAAKMFDKVIVAIAFNPNKKPFFELDHRVQLTKDILSHLDNVEVIGFSGLLADLAVEQDSNILVRGLRAVSDFEYEFQLAGMNRKLNKNIETIFLMSDVENQIISSKFVKEIAELNGDIKKFTTKSTIKSLKKKLI